MEEVNQICKIIVEDQTSILKITNSYVGSFSKRNDLDETQFSRKCKVYEYERRTENLDIINKHHSGPMYLEVSWDASLAEDEESSGEEVELLYGTDIIVYKQEIETCCGYGWYS
jgi:hypothetical protein